MKQVLNIWQKEFKGYFSGATIYMIGFLYSGILAFLFSTALVRFYQFNVQSGPMGRGGGGISSHWLVGNVIGVVNFLMILFVPFLTVRLLTEEKKNRTMDLLLTSPVTSFEIVFGKFLGGFSAAMVLVLFSLIFPLSVSLFTDIQWGLTFSSYMGLILTVAIYTAVGLFASSLTQSILVAGITSLILSASFWFIQWSTAVAEGSQLQPLFEHLSLAKHFEEFAKGNFQISGLVFSLSVVALFVFLAERIVESARWRA